MADNIILVIGASGTMGRPVIERLLASGNAWWTVRALTRDPEGPKARALAALDPERVQLVSGDVNDAGAVTRALHRVDAVFCNTDFFSSMSVRAEYDQGLRVLEAAREAGVRHFVYSSLDNAAGISNGAVPVPHYDSKAAVEGWIDMMRSDEFMREESDGWYSRHVTVLVTAPYYENFQSFFQPQWDTLADGREGFVFAMAAGGRVHPMIATADIAWFADFVLGNVDHWGGRTLRVIGERLTMADVSATFERVTGIPAEGRDVPLEVVEGFPAVGRDLANMHRFLQSGGVGRDDREIRALHPDLMSFEHWLRASGWRGPAVGALNAPRDASLP